VAVLRARQLPSQDATNQLALAQRYLALADQFDEQLGPPPLLLVCGLSGTGKSTVASGISKRLGIEILQTDSVRQQLVREGTLPADDDVARYRPENRERVYDAMFATAGEMLAQHSSVILDGTFLARSQRECAAALAHRHGARWLIIRCECPLEVAQARIAARLAEGGSLSEARPELVEKQQQAFEADEAWWPALSCDTRRTPEELLEDVIDRLKTTASARRT
jgi:predicted kinase